MVNKRKSSVNGCIGRICPCELWVNCINYTDIKTRKWRARRSDKINNISDWYADVFRLKIEAPEGNLNG